jgi:hypothetical protein
MTNDFPTEFQAELNIAVDDLKAELERRREESPPEDYIIGVHKVLLHAVDLLDSPWEGEDERAYKLVRMRWFTQRAMVEVMAELMGLELEPLAPTNKPDLGAEDVRMLVWILAYNRELDRDEVIQCMYRVGVAKLLLDHSTERAHSEHPK